MNKKTRAKYSSILTDEEWEEISPLFKGMRNLKWSKRELTDAVLYINKTGCQWRQLPHDFRCIQRCGVSTAELVRVV